MKIDINKLPKSEIELTIELSPEEWQEYFDEAAKELSQGLKVEGFRPGHVPAKMVEDRIGTTKILEEAAHHCVQHCYVQVIMEKAIEAIGRPEISVLKIAKDNAFIFKAKVAVLPEIKLPDWKKIAEQMQKEKKEVFVQESEIEKSMDWLRNSRAKYITVPRPAQAGDRVEIDFEGESEGKKRDELGSKNHPAVLGKGFFMPDFEKNIVGMKQGEEREFEIDLPDDLKQKDLAGKKASFKAKMNLIQEVQLPETNDEFARSVGNFKDLAALKDSLKEGLLMEKQNQEKDRWRTEVANKIAEEMEAEIPEVLIEGEIGRMKEELRAKVKQVGLEYEQYLERIGKREEDLAGDFKKIAEQRVKVFLVLRQIAKEENIEVSEEEISKEISKALAHFKSPEQAQKEIDIERLKEYTKDALKNEKVFQRLENKSKENKS
ncbi:MAG: trigger factor [Candidatus Portnoybacteria bacterium]|nr:trigger factor [Candidatus Portnoybacteria bacterium]